MAKPNAPNSPALAPAKKKKQFKFKIIFSSILILPLKPIKPPVIPPAIVPFFQSD